MTHQPIRAIVEDVAVKHRLTVADLVGPQRSLPMVRARQEAMYRVRRDLGRSYPQIGAFFRRDHSTVITNIAAYRARFGEAAPDTDPILAGRRDAIALRIQVAMMDSPMWPALTETERDEFRAIAGRAAHRLAPYPAKETP